MPSTNSKNPIFRLKNNSNAKVVITPSGQGCYLLAELASDSSSYFPTRSGDVVLHLSTHVAVVSSLFLPGLPLAETKNTLLTKVSR